MATQHPRTPEILTSLLYDVAMPYRGDGVACALRTAYAPNIEANPAEMIALLAAIDKARSVTDPGSAP